MTDTPNDLRDRIVAALKTVEDPEIPINLYDLGLIYELDLREGGAVHVTMTLTTPNCPVAESMPGRVADAVRGVEGVTDVDIELVWEPAWSREKMSEEAKMAVDMMGIEWADGGRPKTTSLTFGKTGRPR